MFVVPSNMTEEQVLNHIDTAVKAVARRYQFGYYDSDDMFQQGRLFCLEVLHKFDPARGSLENFLKTHLRYRFLNLQRQKLSRTDSPCELCQFNDSGECIAFNNEDECEKCKAWRQRNESKKSLMNTFPVEEDFTLSETFDIPTKLTLQEIFNWVDENLPANLRQDFRRIVDGGTIPKQRRKTVFSKIRQIIREYTKECPENEEN